MIKIWTVIKSSRFVNMLKYVREELQNQRLNRQCIGEDRDGNKYYQYYSYWGLPTRRQIRFKVDGEWDMKDLVYYRWLHKIEFDPPSQDEKKRFYLQQQQRFDRAKLWDKKQQLLMQQFRKKRQQLLLRNQALRQLQYQRQKEDELNIQSKR